MMVSEDEEGFISFDADLDDEIADLFSFGAEGATASDDKAQVDYKEMMQKVIPAPISDDDDSNFSDDSLLELMEQQKEVTVVDPSSVDQNKEQNEGEAQAIDLQEILDWLDADDDFGSADGDEISLEAPPKPEPLEKITAEPEAPRPPPEFDTLEQAVKSPKSTIAQIRILLEKERFSVAASVRPHLWCKVICGKTLEEILQSSVADSFQQWEQAWQKDQEPKSEEQKKQLDWIQKESSSLADRIVMTLNGDVQLSQRALASILLNHYNVAQKRTYDDDDDAETDQEDDQIDAHDPLLPPVACAILSTGVPKVGAAIMLSNIVPNFMPILGLNSKERLRAAHVLHSQFHLLVCYHLPLLALHLDRYLPDWYEGSPTGLVPQSWLLSHLAGECGGAFMNPRWLQCLWDLILTSNNNSLRFFLTVAVLQLHAEQLLLLTGDALTSEVKRVMSFNDNTSDDGFAIEAEDQTTNQQAVQWVHEWTDRAQALWEATPIRVVRKLKHLEDEAVNDALLKRQEKAEERLRLKLEAQALAHQEAVEKDRERNAQEARLRLTRARLVAFYLQHNPGKESNIDKIMETFEGRYEVLDSKLKQKYGVGFNPAVKPKSPAKKGGAGGGSGGYGGGQLFGGKRDEKENESEEEKQPRQLVLKVDPSEAVPSICWSKEANRSKIIKIKEASKLDNGRDGLLPLKFYVVDSRPEEAALAQGRFPTSISMSPEILFDPDLLNQQEGILESLRGMVHICIMGEGYSALPQLYGHRMTRGLSEFIKEDDARNRNCALFFLKRGFPFVSIVDGGFAAMHSFLCREGPSIHLDAQNVLTDYNPEVSLFGQFEKVHNSKGREKAQRKIQNLFDSSMAALTMNTMRFEKSVAPEAQNEQHQQQKSGQNVVTRFFGLGEQSSKEGSNAARSDTSRPSLKEFGMSSDLLEDAVSHEDLLVAAKEKDSSKPAAFRNPFAWKKVEMQDSNSSLEVESVDFDKPQHQGMPQEEKGSKTTPKVTRQPPPNSFSIFKQGQDAPAKKEEATKSAPTKETSENSKSRFSSFGAKFNELKGKKESSEETLDQSQNVPSRNPFSLFGKSNDKKTSTAKGSMVDHFAGFKSKMEKMKTEVFQENKTSNTEKPAVGQPTSSATLVSVLPKAEERNSTPGKINTMPSEAKPTEEDEAVEDPRSEGKKLPGSDQGSVMTASPFKPNAQSTREQVNVEASGETTEDSTVSKEAATKTEESESLDQPSNGPPASAEDHPDQKSSEEVNE